MNIKHCGILPADHVFKNAFHEGGFDKGTAGFSIVERTNKLRKDFFNYKFEINADRAMLLTEAYKEFSDKPIVLKRALSLKHILENIPLYTYEDELIVGNAGAANNSASIYPEFSYEWIMDEMENAPFEKRGLDPYAITEETKEKLRGIEAFWKGNTIASKVNNRLNFEQQKGSNLGVGVYLLNLYHLGGIGHLVLNYERLLEIGYTGYVELLEEKLAQADSLDQDQRDTLEAMLINAKAAITYIKRHAEKFDELAQNEKDERQKSEYRRIAENCHNLTKGAPKNIWEAMQLVHFATMILHIESNGHSISYGRLDQYLYPFYKKDIENGTFTKAFIQELIEAHFIKMGAIAKLRDAMTVLANTGRGFGGESVTLGGVDRDGNDATNDLTFMMLDATAHTRMMVPWTAVRYHENTPRDLKVKATSVIKTGCGHPKLFNDQAAIPSQLRMGRTLEDARDYAVVGCVEISNPGKEFGWHDAAYMNIARVFELAVNDGRCLNCGDHCPRYAICGAEGKKLGLSTGSLTDFTSIEDVKQSYSKQLGHFVDHMADSINIVDATHRELVPTPYVSMFFDNCIEVAKDMSAGGAEFNHTGPQGTGIATVADSLAVIDQLVFKDKKVSREEMLDIVKNNWETNEKIYRTANSTMLKHYGNDDDYADAFAQFTFDTYCEHVEKHETPRGGKYKPGVYGVSSNVLFGMFTGPTFDGRKAGEPISDNMGPVHTQIGSHDVNGPTSIAKSVSKLDHVRASNGTLLNWKFSPSSVEGEAGTNNLIDLMDTYFDRKGMHSQFNIISSATLKTAMENPNEYKNMLVRVAGYSAYFVELSKPLQLDLIARTELAF